jgi:serine/threonine protein kinase
MSPSLNQTLPSGQMLENYRIDRKISAGGFSIVYLAHDENGQPWAIKEYIPQSLAVRGEGGIDLTVPAEHQAEFQRGLNYFFEEARVLSGINHPHVIRVANFFRANGTAYIVMPLEQGCSMQEHIRQQRGPLSEEFIITVFTKLLDGISEVHSNGLLHLDLKPANIWLRTDLGPVVLDFGAARFAVDIGPALPRAMYTPGFAAPEQYHGNYTLGPWTDIYAIGACMYSVMAKTAPQAADARLQADDLQPARQRFGHLYSPRLLIAIDECLRLSPSLRPQSARALQSKIADAGSSGWPAWLRKFRHQFLSLQH